jgi:alpha-ketoglutarate-dependent taurine dioxygenase
MDTKKTALTDTFGMMIENSSHSEIFDLDQNEVIDLFRDAGLLLFRGFNLDTEKFKEFSNSLGKDFLAYIGGAYSRETIQGDKTLLSVTGHKLQFAVPFHGEMYYKKINPGMMWFYCATPALKDGETTICDAIEVYRHLSESTKELFDHHQIKYIRTYIDGSWQQIYQSDSLSEVEKVCQENDMTLTVNDDKSITTEYVCSAWIKSRDGKNKVFVNNILPVCSQEAEGKPASKVRLDDGTKIPEAVINEIKKITDELTFAVPWQSQDLVMLDNRRLMHGRNAFADNVRDIYVRLCNPNFVV